MHSTAVAYQKDRVQKLITEKIQHVDQLILMKIETELELKALFDLQQKLKELPNEENFG